MIQTTCQFFMAAWLCLIVSGWTLAQSTHETKRVVDEVTQSADETVRQDASKPPTKLIDMGAAAPKFPVDSGAWINSETPIAISTKTGELTLVVFESAY